MSQAARQHKLHHALLDALLRAQRTARRRSALWPRLRPLGRQGDHQRRRELLEPGRKTDLHTKSEAAFTAELRRRGDSGLRTCWRAWGACLGGEGP